MRIKKNGWAVWDKENQQYKQKNGMFIHQTREGAWLAANKERKNYPFKVVKVKLQIQ